MRRVLTRPIATTQSAQLIAIPYKAYSMNQCGIAWATAGSTVTDCELLPKIVTTYTHKYTQEG